MNETQQFREKIQEAIGKIDSPEGISDLFRELRYPKKIVFETPLKRKANEFDFKKEDNDKIKEVYSILSYDENLPVFLIETKSLTSPLIRSVTNTFDKQYMNFLLIFSVDYSEIVFVFPSHEKIEKTKHKLKTTKLILNKDELHYTDIETLSNMAYGDEGNWRDLWIKWKKAFDIERVTKVFFEDYKNIFFSIRKELDKQRISRKDAHEATLQLLNRIMFVYFISKKKWLEKSRFIDWIWNSYKKLNKYGSDEFYDKWLRQVFFKAFNNRSDEIKGLPEDVVKVISNCPYLNGGLFRENGLDEIKIQINDKLFQRVFEFFENYNFTVREDMPLDQEVAVDPQMLGYVYESLASVAEEIYDRNDFGIFYTPKIEIDFMCRRTVIEYLSKHNPEVPKEKFYHLLFDLPEDLDKIEKYLTKEKLWVRLEESLDNLSVVDPACGSGAFLVGMLNVLADLWKLIYKHKGKLYEDFKVKLRIIQRCLYGVDVMVWALHAAELRLWLQLIIETDIPPSERRQHPLLPNLDMNLRVGDSLVQEIGGISFNVRTNDLKPHLKKKLDDLKQEKRKYFENSPTAKFKTTEELKTEEVTLFEEIIDERVECFKGDIEATEGEIKRAKSQKNLSGEFIYDVDKVKKLDDEIEVYRDEIEKLKKIKEVLKDPEKKPFIWDIDFAEIFGDKNGFDIVIGNPPYVRQEKISPPNKLKKDVKPEDKREYKQKLAESVNNQFPVVKNISQKSDYYVYFYFHGLSLLNEKGTFCFITSNSWLDVDYGKELQEFLLKYCPITAIYDNPKRSFSHADINTIIAVFGAPRFKEKEIMGLRMGNGWSMLENTAKFVMFKKPFEEVLSSSNLVEIDNALAKVKKQNITELVKNIVNTEDFRLFPIMQEDLLEDGWEYPEDYKDARFKVGSYVGNKWGGKFLRAPDIFYTILDKGKGKIIRFDDIAKIRFGIKTGVNEFFYLDIESQKKWNIEKTFLKPILKTARECDKIIIEPNKLKFKVFVCNKSKSELKGTNALKYIEWGEKQKSESGTLWCNIPSVSGRKNWYSLGEQEEQNFILLRFRDKRNWTPIIRNNIAIGDIVFVGRYLNNVDRDFMDFYLNSSIQVLIVEIYGRKNLGDGLLTTYGPELKVLPVMNVKLDNKKRRIVNNIMKELCSRNVGTIFAEIGIDPSKPIRDQEPKPLPDRKALDKVIFDELGLTEEERKEVYWSVCELVKQRLEKARSFKDK